MFGETTVELYLFKTGLVSYTRLVTFFVYFQHSHATWKGVWLESCSLATKCEIHFESIIVLTPTLFLLTNILRLP